MKKANKKNCSKDTDDTLSLLIQSVSEAASNGADISGGERDDEIGVLARAIQKALRERSRKEDILRAVNNAAAILLAPAAENDFRASLLESMETIGRAVDADRLSIWRNETIEDIPLYASQYVWRSGSDREAASVHAGPKILFDDNPDWKEKFSRGECLNGPLSGLSQSDRDLFQTYNTQSVLLIPIQLQGNFWGFVSVEDCRSERTFTEDEVAALRSAGIMMVGAVNRSENAAHIHEAHERAKLLIDMSPLCANLFDRNGRNFYANEEAVKLFNMKSQKEYLDRFYEFFPEYQPDGQASAEKIAASINKTFDEGRYVLEWTHQLPDGTPVPAEVTFVCVPYGDDFAVAAYMRDLREYKEMMGEIERRDLLLNTVNYAAAFLLQSEPNAFDDDMCQCMGMLAEAVGIDRVQILKNFTKDNRLYCTQLYEWSGGAHPQHGKPYTLDISYDKHLPGWEKKLSLGYSVKGLVRNMSPEEQAHLLPQGIMSVFVLPVFWRDQFWGFISYDDCHRERIFSDNEELILCSGGFLLANALQRNEITRNLYAATAKLEAVVENYAGIIWCVDEDNVITLFAGSDLKKIGIAPGALEGKKLDAALKEYLRLDIPADKQDAFADGPMDWLCEINEKVYRIRTMPVYDESGKMVNTVGSIDDTTERIVLQKKLKAALGEAQEANRAKTNFLATMSHEMRTPLNAIIGLSELTLGSGTITGENYTNVEKISNAGMSLLSTVNDILDISKIEAEKFELIPVEYDTPSLLNDSITQSIVHLKEKPIQFVLNIDENLPARLFGDDLRVKQILNNLMSNAFKYTREGTVTLDFCCEREDGAVWVTARVRDTGIGIRSEDARNLFAAYTQIDSESNRKIGGTGLGLSITKRIVEMMGGTITVESEYGKGSVFTARFRQGFAADNTIGTEVAESLKKLQYSDRKRRENSRMVRISLPYARVLIVDDVETNLDVAKGMMKVYGMRIDCVTSGREAVEIVRAGTVRYNAIFMDHMMPGMDGIEAVRIIRQEIGTEYAKTVPIIVLTANAIVGNEEMFLRKGFQAFVSKPIEMEHLDAVIEEWVRDKEQEKNFPAIRADGKVITDFRRGTERRGGFDRRGLKSKIEGLDMEKGKQRFGGDERSYFDVLRSFAVNTPPLLAELKAVTADNLGAYAVVIHGIKGSSRGICAEVLGAEAEALETAAKAGKHDFVAANNGAFIEAAEKLIAALEEMLRGMDAANPKPVKSKPDAEVLEKLAAACKKYNMDGVDEVMAEIESYSYDKDDGLSLWLRQNVDQVNFAQIIEKISVLCKT